MGLNERPSKRDGFINGPAKGCRRRAPKLRAHRIGTGATSRRHDLNESPTRANVGEWVARACVFWISIHCQWVRARMSHHYRRLMATTTSRIRAKKLQIRNVKVRRLLPWLRNISMSETMWTRRGPRYSKFFLKLSKPCSYSLYNLQQKT